MKRHTKDVEPAGTAAVSSGLAVHNRLPPLYPQRDALEGAVTTVLEGSSGNWDVVLELAGEQALVIAVVAPDGSSWTMTCCNPQHWDPEAVADAVRTGCSQT